MGWWEPAIDWSAWQSAVDAWDPRQAVATVQAQVRAMLGALSGSQALLVRAARLVRTGADELRWQRERARWQRLVAPMLADSGRQAELGRDDCGGAVGAVQLVPVAVIVGGIAVGAWAVAWALDQVADARTQQQELALWTRDLEIRWQAAQRNLHLDPSTVPRRPEDENNNEAAGLLGLLGLSAAIGLGLYLWRAR